MVEPTGGQSIEGEGSVLVTPDGTIVGSADPGNFGGRRGTSRSGARKSLRAQQEAQRKAQEREAILRAEREAKERELNKLKEQQRIKREQERRLQEFLSNQERERIRDLQNRLETSGAREESKVLRDAKTGERIRLTVQRVGLRGERIFTKENLNTGEKVVRTFEKRSLPGGKKGKIIESGGLSSREIKEKEMDTRQSIRPATKLEGVFFGGERLSGETFLRQNEAQRRVNNAISIYEKQLRDLSKEKSIKNTALKFGTQGVLTIVKTGKDVVDVATITPQLTKTTRDFLSKFSKNPNKYVSKAPQFIKSNAKKIPESLKKENLKGIARTIDKTARSTFKFVRLNPSRALGFVAGQIFLFVTYGKVFQAVGWVSSRIARVALSPLFKGAKAVSVPIVQISSRGLRKAVKSKALNPVVRTIKKTKSTQAKTIKGLRGRIQVKDDAKKLRKLVAKRSKAKEKAFTKRTGLIRKKSYIPPQGYSRVFNSFNTLVDNKADTKARQLLKRFKSQGAILDARRELEFVDGFKKIFKERIAKLDEYKLLQRLAKNDLPEEFIIYQKTKRKITQDFINGLIKKLRNKITKLIDSSKFSKKSIDAVRRVSLKVKAIQRKPKRALKRLKEKQRVAKLRRSKRKQTKATLKQGRIIRRLSRKKLKKRASEKGLKLTFTKANRQARAYTSVKFRIDNEALAIAKARVDEFARFVEDSAKKGKKIPNFPFEDVSDTMRKRLEVVSIKRVLGELNNIPAYRTLSQLAEKGTSKQIVRLKTTTKIRNYVNGIVRKVRQAIKRYIQSKKFLREVVQGTKKAMRTTRTQIRKPKRALKKLKEKRRVRKIVRGKQKEAKADLKRARKLRKLSRKRLGKSKPRPSINGFRLVNSKNARKVSISQLQDETNRGVILDNVDRLFNQVAYTSNVDTTNPSFIKFKRLIKEKIVDAYNRRNKQEIKRYIEAIKQMGREANQKVNNAKIIVKFEQPTRGTKISGVKRRVITAKDFDFPSPQGTYREVKVGQQVLVQEVKQEVRQEARQKVVQKARVVSVEAQRVSIRPLLKALNFSILQGLRGAFRSFTRLDFKRNVGIAQDFARVVDQRSAVSQVFGSSPTQATTQNLTQGRTQASAQASRVAQRTKLALRLQLRSKGKIGIPPIKLKKRFTKRLGGKSNSYNVFARPLKRRGTKKNPKLIKVNKVPLTIQRARDLRNYITDTSLSRTAQLKPSSAKPQTPKLRVPVNYSRKTAGKFRRFKIVRGKRVRLPRSRVIERTKNILDTRQEKKKISLARRIAQLTPKSKVNTQRRKKTVLRRARNSNKPLSRRKKPNNKKKRK